MDIFSIICSDRPIIIDGAVTTYDACTQPKLMPLSTDELEGPALFEHLIQVANYRPSALASRIYGLEQSLEEFAK